MFLVVLMFNQMFSSGTLKPAKVLVDQHFGFKIGSDLQTVEMVKVSILP